MRFTEPMPTSDLTPTWLVHDPSNAVLEWQARSMGVAKLKADGGLSTRRACSKCRLRIGNVHRP
jgi:hypothetical protein